MPFGLWVNESGGLYIPETEVNAQLVERDGVVPDYNHDSTYHAKADENRPDRYRRN